MRSAGLHRLATRVTRTLPELLQSCDPIASAEVLSSLSGLPVVTPTQQTFCCTGRSGVGGHPSWQTAPAHSRGFATGDTPEGSETSASEQAAAAESASTAADGGAGQAEGSSGAASEGQQLRADSSGEDSIEQEGADAAAEPDWPPYVEPEFPPLPPVDWAPWLIKHIQRQRDGQEKPIVLNFAGEHSSGWEILDVDEENLITWFVLDLAGGRVPDNDENALLSDATKAYMYKLRKQAKWSVEQIAKLFAVRQQRVAAIIALREEETLARARGDKLHDELAAKMDFIYGCDRLEGTGERHVKLLPTAPKFEVVDPEARAQQLQQMQAMQQALLGTEQEQDREQQAGMQGALGQEQGRMPKQREQGGSSRGRSMRRGALEDPGWESELRVREDEVARYEERILVREFMQRLAFNTGKVGVSIRNESLRTQPPARPKGGWSIVVRPAGRNVDFEPFVAQPGGHRRPLARDEELYLDRMKPRPRRKFL